MYRSNTCGELNTSFIGKNVTLAGWVQKIRDKGGLIWIDLRDRYGITQIILNESEDSANLIAIARNLGREYVIQVKGIVIERTAKNDKMATGPHIDSNNPHIPSVPCFRRTCIGQEMS
jgi:aspartyl-tRNA synthetase